MRKSFIFVLVCSCVLLGRELWGAEQAEPLRTGVFTEELTVPQELPVQGSPLSVEEATRLALARNLDIQIARLEIQSEAYENQIARSIYDSQISAEATYSHDREERTSALAPKREIIGSVQTGLEKKIPLGTTLGVEAGSTRNSSPSLFSTLNPHHRSFITLSVEQPLLRNFFGYVDRNEIKKVKLNVRKFTYQKLDEIEISLAEVRRGYWDLVLAYRNLEARLLALRKAQDFYSITLDKQDLGIMENPDVFAAEANVRKRVIEVWEAVTNLYAASNRMKVLLRRPEVEFIEPRTIPEFHPLELDFDHELQEAYESRRDLKQVLLELEQKQIDLKISKNQLLPELQFEGNLTPSGLDEDLKASQGEAFGFRHKTFFAGFRISTSLEQQSERAAVAQSRLFLKTAEESLEKTRLVIQQEMDDAYRRLELANREVRQTQEIGKLQRQKLEEEEKNFNRGRSDSKTIIDFQEDVIDAEVDAIRALIEYKHAEENFYETQDQLFERIGLTEEAI